METNYAGLKKNCLTIFNRLKEFSGPGFIIAVSYIDPGNYATNLNGGSLYGYSLLVIILLSNLIAVLLQHLSIRLGAVTNMDIAQTCRKKFPMWLNIILWIISEIGIIACDVAEVIGSASALYLLFGCPLTFGILITGLDVFIILAGYNQNGSLKSIKIFEIIIGIMVLLVGICISIQLNVVNPDFKKVFAGYLPDIQIINNPGMFYSAMAIMGATVMPHSLYLGSHMVKSRNKLQEYPETLLSIDCKEKESFIKTSIFYSTIDIIFSLSFAFFINSSLLIIAATVFYYASNPLTEGVADLFVAYDLFKEKTGYLSAILYAISLLLSGQSSTITATMAGQIIMEGFTGWKSNPIVRRLVTRSFSIIPALVIVLISGHDGLANLLVLSQIVLSIQLPFVIIPLVIFVGTGSLMIYQKELVTENDVIGEKKSLWNFWRSVPKDVSKEKIWRTSNCINVLSIVVCATLTILNGYLVFVFFKI